MASEFTSTSYAVAMLNVGLLSKSYLPGNEEPFRQLPMSKDLLTRRRVT